jgi:hypothetical protein
VRNKTHLVAHGFSQVEGLDFEKIFALVVRLEAIMILLVFTAFKRFKHYQMDVKSVLLNGVIREEVYVRKPPSIPIECTSFQMLYTSLSKRRGLGMLGLRYFC